MITVLEACFNQHLLRQPNGQTKWQLPTGTRQFSLNLVLPRDLTCSQCVLQWKWTTGEFVSLNLFIAKTTLKSRYHTSCWSFPIFCTFGEGIHLTRQIRFVYMHSKRWRCYRYCPDNCLL